MNDDLEAIGRLAGQPWPRRLSRIEADVSRRIAKAGVTDAFRPSLRIAAVCLALVLGVGVGGNVAAPDRAGYPSGLTAGSRLAPSSLLSGAR